MIPANRQYAAVIVSTVIQHFGRFLTASPEVWLTPRAGHCPAKSTNSPFLSFASYEHSTLRLLFRLRFAARLGPMADDPPLHHVDNVFGNVHRVIRYAFQVTRSIQ